MEENQSAQPAPTNLQPESPPVKPEKKQKPWLATGFLILLIISFFFLVNPQPAWAYLDPGSGSYLTQIIIASLLSSGLLIKAYWVKIKKTLGKLFRKTRSKQVSSTDESKD